MHSANEILWKVLSSFFLLLILLLILVSKSLTTKLKKLKIDYSKRKKSSDPLIERKKNEIDKMALTWNNHTPTKWKILPLCRILEMVSKEPRKYFYLPVRLFHKVLSHRKNHISSDSFFFNSKFVLPKYNFKRFSTRMFR